MPDTGTFTINKVKSGKTYKFYIYKLPVNFRKEGGVYLFTKILSNGATHKYIYLGITEDLSTRLENHHKKNCIQNNGATHLLAFINNSKSQREFIEKDILGAIKTTCNEQLN